MSEDQSLTVPLDDQLNFFVVDVHLGDCVVRGIIDTAAHMTVVPAAVLRKVAPDFMRHVDLESESPSNIRTTGDSSVRMKMIMIRELFIGPFELDHVRVCLIDGPVHGAAHDVAVIGLPELLTFDISISGGKLTLSRPRPAPHAGLLCNIALPARGRILGEAHTT